MSLKNSKKAPAKKVISKEDIQAYQAECLKKAQDYMTKAMQHIEKEYGCKLITTVSLDPKTRVVNAQVMVQIQK